MHISDIALACSQRCAQLALKCTNEEVAIELNILAVRLMVAAAKDAELLVNTSSKPAADANEPPSCDCGYHQPSLIDVAR